MLRLWSERYAAGSGRTGVKRLALRSYYTVRPVLPRAVRSGCAGASQPRAGTHAVPAWPLEPSLHDHYDCCCAGSPRSPASRCRCLGAWPDGHGRWALVLTHDVETARAATHAQLLRGLEARTGYRSSWNFVPERYATPDALVESLKADGFEVGVHGLHHDGRDLESRRAARAAAARDSRLRRALGRGRVPLAGHPPRAGT